MQIYSVNGDFYTSYDLAVINALGTHYKVKKHSVDETEIEISRDFETSRLYIHDESGNEYDIEFDVNFTFNEEEESSQSYTDFEIQDIQIDGYSTDTMDISNDLKKEVWYEADSVAYRMAESKHDNK